MADVCVSYARSDKARVAPLVAAIEADGMVGPGDLTRPGVRPPDRRRTRYHCRYPRGLNPEVSGYVLKPTA
jgi:hypothetical protein